MLVSLKWLKDYVNIDMDAQEFGDKMTMTGTKTELVMYPGEELSNVVVAKVVSIDKHPDADKLIVTQLEVGQDELLQIVTAAKNVKVGDYLPVALHKSTLAGGLKIKKGKLRGVPSFGMMCSHEELGIDEKYVEDYKKDGIYILDMLDEYVPGQDIKEALGLNDAIIDFELTSNRPDCRCMLGIAREAAVTLDTEIKYPEVSVKEESDKEIDVEIEIANSNLCQRYMARRITDVKVGKSPYWMQRRLMEVGIRPINNIVDITNYVMLEMGQPMHAFDMREIENNKIVVKNAIEGEVFTTLDGQERSLKSDMLMITNGEKNLSIAGIMGGEESGVKEDTTEVMFETASFSKENIRKTSKVLGLRSESSSRFEKGIAIKTAEEAIERACQLVEELGCGKVMKGRVDVNPVKQENQTLTISPKKINSRVGVDIPMDKFVKILEDLEFTCDLKSAEELVLGVPNFRLDIVEEADILEEITRIYGFENLPSVQLQGNSTAGVKTEKQKFLDKVKETCMACGLYETLTYSFVSPKGLDKIRVPEDSKLRNVVKLINPLGEDTSIMRTTMIPNMMDVLYTNVSRNIEEVAIFEAGHVFTPEDMAGVEETRICLGMVGEGTDFYTIKGITEKIFERVGLEGYKFVSDRTNSSFHPGRCANIVVGNVTVATIGEMHPLACENYGISKRVYISEINLDKVFEIAEDTIVFKALPKYPAITRDIALLVKNGIEVAQIEEIILEDGHEFVEDCKLFDVYEGDQIEEGHKSIAYSIVYRSLEDTLTDDQIAPVHKTILEKLEEKLGAKQR